MSKTTPDVKSLIAKLHGGDHNSAEVSPMMRSSLLLAVFAANSNQYTPTFPGGIIAWVICNARKRHEYGGWLLFFYWQLYSGILMTLLFFSINFQSYVPENFQNPATYYLFLGSVLPTLVIFALQVAVGTILISVRTWDLLRLLRWLILAQVIAASISTVIDIKYFPDNVALGLFFSLVPETLWLAYFFKSKRVQHVFQLHDWDVAVNTLYPTQTKIVA
jgi:hypothetical protein